MVWRVVLAMVALAFTACGGNGGDGDPGTGTPPPAPAPTNTTTTTTTPVQVAGLDLGAGGRVELGDGWTLAPCEAGPPLFCLAKDGAVQGTFELLSQPVASYPTVQAVLDRGGTTAAALEQQARDFQQAFLDDRPKGCGAGYEVTPFGPAAVEVAGTPGVRYGFDGADADGRHVERVLQFATIEGKTLHLLAISAAEPDSCMADGEQLQPRVGELADLEDRLAAVVAASTLPAR